MKVKDLLVERLGKSTYCELLVKTRSISIKSKKINEETVKRSMYKQIKCSLLN